MQCKPLLEHLENRLVPATAAIDGMGNLVVTGEADRDSITVNSTNPAAVTVTVDGINLGTFDLSGGGRVIIYGLGDRDFIQTPGYLPTEVHGGDGNDTIYGGSGSDVVYGDAGDDYVSTGVGNDVLIGGDGRDYLLGGNGEDILVGDQFTTMDRSYADLQADLVNWMATHNTTSLDALFAELSDDGDRDTLSGGTGADAFVDPIGVAEVLVDVNVGQGDLHKTS